MNLVDSSGWLEYLADETNAPFFAPALEATGELLVSSINVYEVFKRVLQQRGEDDALRAAALMQQATVAEVTAPIAMSAAKLSRELGLAMADSLILATAQAWNAIVWTQDAHLEGMEGVRFVRK